MMEIEAHNLEMIDEKQYKGCIKEGVLIQIASECLMLRECDGDVLPQLADTYFFLLSGLLQNVPV